MKLREIYTSMLGGATVSNIMAILGDYTTHYQEVVINAVLATIAIYLTNKILNLVSNWIKSKLKKS